MAKLSSVVMFSGHPEACVAFYRAIGIPLEDEDHGDGALHAAADVDGVHLAVLPGTGSDMAPTFRAAGASFAGFWVHSLDATVAALAALGTPVLVDHQMREWGCRTVVADPDGRPVEINQEDHCDGSVDDDH
jgi:catechol 2,3-dioxygenase-like lactoylglutathione lyase family enzyme